MCVLLHSLSLSMLFLLLYVRFFTQFLGQQISLNIADIDRSFVTPGSFFQIKEEIWITVGDQIVRLQRDPEGKYALKSTQQVSSKRKRFVGESERERERERSDTERRESESEEEPIGTKGSGLRRIEQVHCAVVVCVDDDVSVWFGNEKGEILVFTLEGNCVGWLSLIHTRIFSLSFSFFLSFSFSFSFFLFLSLSLSFSFSFSFSFSLSSLVIANSDFTVFLSKDSWKLATNTSLYLAWLS